MPARVYHLSLDKSALARELLAAVIFKDTLSLPSPVKEGGHKETPWQDHGELHFTKPLAAALQRCRPAALRYATLISFALSQKPWMLQKLAAYSVPGFLSIAVTVAAWWV